MNGQTSPSFKSSIRGKHTVGFSLDALQAKVTHSMSLMGDDADKFGVWAKTKLTSQEAIEMLKLTIAKVPDSSLGEERHNPKLLEKLMDLYRAEDSTLYGLYNALTAYSTHEKTRSNSNPITSLLGREGRVADTIRSKEWTQAYAI